MNFATPFLLNTSEETLLKAGAEPLFDVFTWISELKLVHYKSTMVLYHDFFLYDIIASDACHVLFIFLGSSPIISLVWRARDCHYITYGNFNSLGSGCCSFLKWNYYLQYRQKSTLSQSIQKWTKHNLCKIAFKKFEEVWSDLADHTPPNSLKAVFYKLYSVHSLILCSIFHGQYARNRLKVSYRIAVPNNSNN